MLGDSRNLRSEIDSSESSTHETPNAIELGDSPIPESSQTSNHDAVMRTLEPGRWLSDEAINTYTSCLAITVNEKASTEAVYAYTTFLYSNVITRGYVYTIKWTKAVDIFTKRVLLLPIHLDSHWIAVAIFPRLRRIAYYNSLPVNLRDVEPITDDIFQYLAYEHFDKQGVPFDLTDWRAVAYLAGPHQSNLVDCGVYACAALAEFAQWTTMKDPSTPLFEERSSRRADMRAELGAWHSENLF